MRRDDLENRLKKGKINKIPRELDKKINNLLENIDLEAEKQKREKNKKKGYKKIAMVAGIALAIGMGGTGAIAFTNYETQEKLYDIFGLEEAFGKYSSRLNEEIIKDDIGITISDVVTDGECIYISYEIRGIDKEFMTGEYYFLEEGKSKKNNEKLESGLNYVKRNENGLKAIHQFKLNREEKIKSVYKDEIEFELKFINGSKEKVINKWRFKFPISNEVLIQNIRVYDLNKEVSKGIVEKVIVTPLNIYIKGKGDINIDIKDSSGNIERAITGWGNEGEYSAQFENKFNEEKLSIVEIDEVYSDDRKEKEISVEINENGFKQIGDYGVEIIDIKNENGKTIIKYKAKDVNNLCFDISSENHPYFETKERFIDKEIRELVLINGILERGNVYKFTHFEKSDTKYGREIEIK